MRRLFHGLVYLYVTMPTVVCAQAQDPFLANIRPTDPLTPEQEQKTFRLPPGFVIQLFASEPDILKPMNMAFDGHGRMWITESTEYPYAAPLDRKGRDNIKILEDTDGDGRADRITTFADGLNIPIGIYPYAEGAIAFSIPHIWKFQDTDGDDVADVRKRLYGPMGYERDTHGLHNAFRRGFDGWLYACHGFNNETTVSGTDGHTITMQSGNVYRMRLDGSRIEHFTWGQVNPFGMALDSLFNIFTADCHSKPLTQLLRNAYYPSFGKPHDGLGFVPPMMEHLHGSTAIAGVALYTGDRFPPPFRHNTFGGNVMTSRVNRNTLDYRGSTILAREAPDFVSTSDPWFRPVDLVVGPDGALYVADFYNRIIGHYEVPLDHPGRDRHRGRIWRIVYEGDDPDTRPAARATDLTTATADELIDVLDETNLTRRLSAMDQLVDRLGSDARLAVRAAARDAHRPRVRGQALWVLHRLHDIRDDDLASAVADAHRSVRVHAMKILSETETWSAAARQWAVRGLSDDDPFARRAAADALGRHPNVENVRPLMDALAEVPEEDNHLRHVIRMALRDQLVNHYMFAAVAGMDLREPEYRALASVCLAVHHPAAGAFLLRYLERFTDDRTTTSDFAQHVARHTAQHDTERLIRLMRGRFADDVEAQFFVLRAIHNGVQQRGAAANETLLQWASALAEQLLATDDPGTAAIRHQDAAAIVSQFKLYAFQGRLVELLLSEDAKSPVRMASARAVVALDPDPRRSALVAILGEPVLSMQLRREIVQAVARPVPAKVDEVLGEAFRSVPQRLQASMAQILAADRTGAQVLIQLAEAGRASARLLQNPVLQNLLHAVLPEDMRKRMDQLVARLPSESRRINDLIASRRQSFPNATKSAKQGAEVFTKHCAVCHQMDGTGALVGPQLDGIGNRGAERLIEDILDPNRNVDVAFRTSTVLMDNGRVLTGLFQRQSGAMSVFADSEGKEFSVPTGEIEESRKSQNSLMPENLADTLTPGQFYDVVSYLLTKRAAPPSAASSSVSRATN